MLTFTMLLLWLTGPSQNVQLFEEETLHLSRLLGVSRYHVAVAMPNGQALELRHIMRVISVCSRCNPTASLGWVIS